MIKNNKKIKIFIGTLCSGGAERVISVISKGIIERFEDIEIILYYNREIFYTLDNRIKIRVIEKETGSKNILKNMCWLRKYIKKDDLVLSFLAPFNMLAIIALLFKNKIMVANRNDPNFIPKNYFLRKIRDFLYNFAKQVICQTENNKKYFSKSIQKKTKVIYNPIYITEEKGVALITKKENIIVSVGRLDKQKNQILLLDSFNQVLKKFPDYKLVIYGEGKERKVLESYIKKLGMEKNVFLPGTTNEVHKKIIKAKCFIMTSDYEGMPNALLEAMSLGLPCISTKVSGAIDLIENEVNGILVDRNPEIVSEEILKIIENESYAKRLGNNASNLYDQLSEEKIIKQWIEILNKI